MLLNKSLIYASKSSLLECRWRQTGGCRWDGEREPQNDKNCDVVIETGSGYCECSDLSKKMKKGCNKAGDFQTCYGACGGI